MELLTENIKRLIETLVIAEIYNNNYKKANEGIAEIISAMYDSIPQNKRISYGIVHTVKELGKYLFIRFEKNDVYNISSSLYDNAENSESKAVSLCMLSFYGLKESSSVLPYFEKAAADNDWELREISQILFRKLIKDNKDEIKTFLLSLVKSEDENVRRFAGETLRPVCENKWFYKQPEYSLSIIRHLFKENKAYPRTSVGNNLSDLARHQPELVYKLVEELVANGDKNSYWIAYRACRNLVKKEPERVMSLLKTDTYKYKKRVHLKEQND